MAGCSKNTVVDYDGIFPFDAKEDVVPKPEGIWTWRKIQEKSPQWVTSSINQ